MRDFAIKRPIIRDDAPATPPPAVRVICPPVLTGPDLKAADVLMASARIGNAALGDCPQPNVAAIILRRQMTDSTLVICTHCEVIVPKRLSVIEGPHKGLCADCDHVLRDGQRCLAPSIF